MPFSSVFPAQKNSPQTTEMSFATAPLSYAYQKSSEFVATLVKASLLFYKTVLFHVVYTVSSRFIKYEHWIHFSLSCNLHEELRTLMLQYFAMEFPEREVKVTKKKRFNPTLFSCDFSDQLTSKIGRINQKIKQYNRTNQEMRRLFDQLKKAIESHNESHNSQIPTIKILIANIKRLLTTRTHTMEKLSFEFSSEWIDDLERNLDTLSTGKVCLTKKIGASFTPIEELEAELSFPTVLDTSVSLFSIFSYTPSEEVQKINSEIQTLSFEKLFLKEKLYNETIKRRSLKETFIAWNRLIGKANERDLPKANLLDLSKDHPTLLKKPEGLEDGFIAFPMTKHPKSLPTKGRWILVAPSVDAKNVRGSYLSFHEMLEETLEHFVEEKEQNVLVVNTEKLFMKNISLEKYLRFLEEEIDAEEIILVGDELGGLLVADAIKEHAEKNGFDRGKKYLVAQARVWSENCSFLQKKFAQTVGALQWNVPKWISHLCHEYIAFVVRSTNTSMDSYEASMRLKELQIHEYILDNDTFREEEKTGIEYSLFNKILKSHHRFTNTKTLKTISSTSAPTFLRAISDMIREQDIKAPSPCPKSTAHQQKEDGDH